MNQSNKGPSNTPIKNTPALSLLNIIKKTVRANEMCVVEFQKTYKSELMGVEKKTSGEMRFFQQKFYLSQKEDDSIQHDVIFDGKNFWLLEYDKTKQTTRPQQITRSRNPPVAQLFKKLFQTDAIKKSFKIKNLVSEGGSEDGNKYLLEPINLKDFAFKKIIMVTTKDQLESIELIDDVNNVSQFKVTSNQCYPWKKAFQKFFHFSPLKSETINEI